MKVFWFDDETFRTIDEALGWLVTTPEGRKLYADIKAGKSYDLGGEKDSPRQREKLNRVLDYVVEKAGVYGENGVLDLSLEGSDTEFRKRITQEWQFYEHIGEDNILMLIDGVRQPRPHGGYDPLEHTYNLLKILETDNLDFKINNGGVKRSPAELVRTAALLHDIGKAVSGLSEKHPVWGAKIAEAFLRKTQLYSITEVELISLLGENHNLLTDVILERKDATEINSIVEKAEKLGLTREQFLLMLENLNKADVVSIPGFGQMRWNDMAGEVRQLIQPFPKTA